MTKSTHVVDHAYAMTDGGGFTPGHYSKHASLEEADTRAKELATKHRDGNFHARRIEKGDRPYKEHEAPYWGDGKGNKGGDTK